MRGFVGDQALVGILLILLCCGSFCYGTVEVVGLGECGDCKENNIKTTHALSGLKVTIDCKVEDGKFQTRGVGKLNEEGHFKVSLPQEILKDGKLAEECYVQLHNAANAPCAFHSGLEAAKITLVSKSNEKHTFGPTGKLKFSSAVCTSAFFWPIFKHPHLPKPSFPKGHPWLKKFGHVFPLPPKVLPPFPLPPKIPFKKPCPPPVPVYKPKPEPPVYKPKPEPPVYKPKPEPPVYKPKPEPPIYKPKPEPPVYKPKPKPEPPVYKPKPEPPVYKPKPKPEPPVYKPKPEPPVYKPKPKPEPPVYKPEPKPEPPVYKPEPKPKPPVYKPKPEPPVYKPKPEPPIYKPHPKILPPPIPIYKPHPKILPPIPIYKPLPPFYKKPCPPFSLPKLPPLPTIPPKDFHHPIIPLPPHP